MMRLFVGILLGVVLLCCPIHEALAMGRKKPKLLTMKLVGPTQLEQGQCKQYFIRFFQGRKPTSNVPAGKRIQLMERGSGGSFYFYTDGKCSKRPIRNLWIRRNQRANSFYYQSIKPGKTTLVLRDLQRRLRNASLTVKINLSRRISREEATKEVTKALLSLYQAEKGFLSEYSDYSTFISQIGFDPKVTKNYTIGFSTLSHLRREILIVFPDADEGPINTSGNPRCEFADQGDSASFNFCNIASQHCGEGKCTATQEGYQAIAVANLDDDPELDIWTIDHSGAIRQITADFGQINNANPWFWITPELVRKQLEGIYVAEQAFFAEYGEYTTYIDKAGFNPGPGIKKVYSFGFSFKAPVRKDVLAVFPDLIDGIINTSDNSLCENPPAGSTSGKIDFCGVAEDYCPELKCTVDGNKFMAIAVGNIDADPKLDIWLINQKREIIHVSDDTK